MPFDPISAVVGFLSGGTFGSLVTWFATNRREKAGRIRVVRAFIATWRSKVHRTAETELLAKEFPLLIDELQGHVSTLKHDLPRRKHARFDQLCFDLREAGARVTETKDGGKEQIGRAHLRDTLKTLEDFL